ncbi:DUF6959 family protein [Micromonospora sp. CA-259024]|uniref:DUF6959 family protein n=1 Tax=Micromonospora sp. CA-259024 TaxID=3239965 RepID=UPI003D8A93AC
MSQEQAQVLSRGTNCAVVQLAGRAFPGIHVQGDTFAALLMQLADAARLLRHEPRRPRSSRRAGRRRDTAATGGSNVEDHRRSDHHSSDGHLTIVERRPLAAKRTFCRAYPSFAWRER